MTEDKVIRLVKAFTVAGISVLFFLFLILGVQLVRLQLVKRERAELAEEIARLEEQIEAGEGSLEYYRSDAYREMLARQQGYKYPEDQ